MSPVTPAPSAQHSPPIVPVYNSYESSSLASAGYSHPPSQQPQPQQLGYGRTLPAPTSVHATESSAQPALATHFNYGQAPPYHPSASSAADRYGSSRPVLAPIQDTRVMRGEPAPATTAMRYPSSSQTQSQPQAQAQPPMQQPLASMGRDSASGAHPYSYASQPQAPAHASSAHGYTASVSAGEAPPPSPYTHAPTYSAAHAYSGYYSHAPAPTSHHAPRDASPDTDPAADPYLELHQPQPQRVLPPPAQHQYLQPTEVLASQHGHQTQHPVWRADEYRGRLVQ